MKGKSSLKQTAVQQDMLHVHTFIQQYKCVHMLLMTCVRLFSRDQQSRDLQCKSVQPMLMTMITMPPCAPDKRSLMHSSHHRSQFIFISESHRLVVYINILPYRIPFNKTSMWIEKRSCQFLNYLLSVLYLLPVTWEGLGLLPTARSSLASIRRI